MKGVLTFMTALIAAVVSPESGATGADVTDGKIVIENARMRLRLNPLGYAESLLDKTSSEECLDTSARVPLCTIMQERPYDNENFLMYPAKPKVFPANKIRCSGDTLYVEFENTFDIAVISVEERDDYIGFRIERIDYRIEDIGVKRKTEIDALAMLQLPVMRRQHFGEWMNVTWDEGTAVCLMGTTPETRIDAYPDREMLGLYAGAEASVGIAGIGAALIVSPKDEFLDCVAMAEKDFQMPDGVGSRRDPHYMESYYELRDVTRENIDEHIRYAKAGGFRAMVVYYPDFASTCGHFLWNDRFPGGMEDLKFITGKIREAGMTPGFHIHYSKVSIDDPYINAGVPDARLNAAAHLVLSADAGAEDIVLNVEHVPTTMFYEDGRRIVQIDDELICYSIFSAGTPGRLEGCSRGILGTSATAHRAGTHFRLLDVDTWPRFIRIDQNTSLQDEVAERLAKIYSEAGFEFLYFDGAEDVPMPYWYNVSKAQLSVYQKLDPKPLYSEGALKSHYGWHILTRGNAFDLFRPEQIREAMKKYTLPCVERIADDFTAVDFGWADYLAPDSLTIGMQPDMYEYIYSKAAAWDAPVSVMGKLDEIRSHPRTDDNFEVMRRWEEAKLSGKITPEWKDLLKDPDAEYFMLCRKDGELELLRYFQVKSPGSAVRAFSFSRNGRNCLIFWDFAGNGGEMEMDVDGHDVRLYDTEENKVRLRKRGGKAVLPLGRRLIIDTDMEMGMLIERFQEAAEH